MTKGEASIIFEKAKIFSMSNLKLLFLNGKVKKSVELDIYV